MLTGHVLYPGETVSDIVAKILEREPDWDRLPIGHASSGVRKLLRRCLTKDARKRQQSAGDARLEIEDALSGSPEKDPASTATVPSRSRAMVLALLAIPVAALGAWLLKPNSDLENTSPIHSEINAPEGIVVSAIGNSLVLSPDGTRLAFIGRAHHEDAPDTTRIYIRSLDEDQAMLVPGTESVIGTGPSDLFFSPDGRWLGFTDMESGLKKIEIGRGSPVTICESLGYGGSTWGAGDQIVFSAQNVGLLRVSAAGGEPDTITKPEGLEVSHTQPRFLPDGRRLLFTARGFNPRDWNRAAVHLLDTETGDRKLVLKNAGDARYLATGHILFSRETNVFAAPFDPGSGEITGEAVPVLQGVRRTIDFNWTPWETGATAYTVSENGLLAYVPGSYSPGWRSRLVWVDAEGNEEPVGIREGRWATARVSPDGSRVLVSERSIFSSGTWIYDIPRGTLRRQSMDETFPGGRNGGRGKMNSASTQAWMERPDSLPKSSMPLLPR